MDVSVVICTHNRCELLRMALHALGQMKAPAGVSWEVLVVDNNSSDRTRVVVEEFAARASCEIIYLYEARQGKSFALNAGVARARGRILAFTDDDATVDPEWLGAIVRGFPEHDCIGIGGRIVQTWPAGKPDWLENLERTYRPMTVLAMFDLGSTPRECTTRTPPFGANMAFRREAFQRYGAFVTTLGPRGGGRGRVGGGAEDTEFGRRLMAAGERVMYLPSAVVSHPVDEARATQRYFLKWYFNYGRISVRRAAAAGHVPEGTLGHLRVLGACLYRWLIARNRDQRLARKLRLYQQCGVLVEVFTGRRELVPDA